MVISASITKKFTKTIKIITEIIMVTLTKIKVEMTISGYASILERKVNTETIVWFESTTLKVK